MAYLTGQVLTQADIAALFTSGTYTPTLGNMAIGTGGTPTNTAKFTFVGFPAGGILTVEGKIKFGTTAPTLPGAGVETVSLPSGYTLINVETWASPISAVDYGDVSGGIIIKGCMAWSSSTVLAFQLPTISGSFLNNSSLTATLPFVWAVSDEIHWRVIARCTGP